MLGERWAGEDTRPYGVRWFLMRGTTPQAVQAEAGQFQRDFFSVPPTYARVRGKRDHGGVKTIRADSKTHGLDLGAFLGSVRGHSLARQRMVPHNYAVEGLAYTHHPNGTRPYGDEMVFDERNRPSSCVGRGGSISTCFLQCSTNVRTGAGQVGPWGRKDDTSRF